MIPPQAPALRDSAHPHHSTTPGSADRRRWELRSGPTSVTAVTPTGTVAEARVSERDEQVVVEFWADWPGVPDELSDQLVSRAFSLDAVRPHRPVLVCVPQHDGEVIAQARRRLEDARTRVAGVTCLLEGRIGEPPAAPADRTSAPR